VLLLFREAYHFIESGDDKITDNNVGTKLKVFPFSMAYTGRIDRVDGAMDTMNSGRLWTALSDSDVNASYVYFGSSQISNPTSTKHYGFSVR